MIIIINFFKKTKNKKLNFKFNELDELSPSYINFSNPKYIEIENKFISSIIIVDYFREQNDLILKSLIDSNININISIFYEKKNPYKIIKDLTYNIGNVSVDISNTNKNRQDIDIMEYTYDDAKYIRKQMQINNEEFYFLYIYISVYANTLKELESNIDKIEGILQSKGMRTRKSYFRQEQAFISTLP